MAATVWHAVLARCCHAFKAHSTAGPCPPASVFENCNMSCCHATRSGAFTVNGFLIVKCVVNLCRARPFHLCFHPASACNSTNRVAVISSARPSNLCFDPASAVNPSANQTTIVWSSSIRSAQALSMEESTGAGQRAVQSWSSAPTYAACI